MCLVTLHDKVRNLGLGLMYEKHWGQGGFRDLFDQSSPDWAASGIIEKVNDLKAFESAGIPADELIAHYRETYTQEGNPGQVLDRLPTAMQAYREAGYCPRLPDDIAAALGTDGAQGAPAQ